VTPERRAALVLLLGLAQVALVLRGWREGWVT
jgi:hypothetical protein